jgi:LPXTG-motif cell wall-anchored protein
MRLLTPFAVVYLLVAALILPASPLAADDVTTAPESAAPTDTTTAPAAPQAQPQAQASPSQPQQAPAGPAPQPSASPPAAAPAAAGASKSKSRKSKSRPVAHAASPGSVTIKDFAFGPGTVTVNVGETVTWTNNGPTGHSATARNGSFDTGVLPKGKSASHTFTQAGTFAYICKPHPFMHGTVRVVAASSGGGSSNGSSSSSGSTSSGTSGSSSSGAAAAPGSSASSGSSGSASGASLPRTGADAGALALLGVLLLGLGAVMRRRSSAA